MSLKLWRKWRLFVIWVSFRIDELYDLTGIEMFNRWSEVMVEYLYPDDLLVEIGNVRPE